MKPTRAALTLLAALPLSAGAGAAPIAQAVEFPAGVVVVELSETAISAAPGEKINFESTVSNNGDLALSGLIAHLNILSSDPDVYVDPEDWSPRRTQFLDSLDPAATAPLQWQVQAVTTGPLILYVAVSQEGADDVAVSGQLRMTVGGQREVNAGGVVPLVLGVPGVVLVLLGLVGYRRRRQR